LSKAISNGEEGVIVDAIAVSNNDVVQVVWRYREKIPECLGFEVYRQENGAEPQGTWTPLPAWVGFKGEKNPEWQEKTTTVWAVAVGNVIRLAREANLTSSDGTSRRDWPSVPWIA
jgi:hypothetical protein